MRFSRRFVLTLLIFVFVLALVPPEKVFARFTALPDFYGQDPDNVNQGSWPVGMYGDCETVTVSLSQPSNPYIPYPVPETYVEYEYARWTLEQVRDFNDNPIAVDETGAGLIIGDFYLDELSGTTKSNTFNFSTPLAAGEPFYVIVRYSIYGGELGYPKNTTTYTGTFEVGDFDHPYWGARANDTSIGSNVEFFCNQAVKDAAPTVSIIGDYVRAEGSVSSSTDYLIQLQLDKPSTEDIWLDLQTDDGGYFPDTYATLVGFNGYRASPTYDPNPCADLFDYEQAECEQQVPDYTRLLIPAGQTYAEAVVRSRFVSTSRDEYWYTAIPRVLIIRASNALIGGQSTRYLRSRNDDGCNGFFGTECGFAFYYPGGSYPDDDRDQVSFTVANLKASDIDPNTGVATFTVNLIDSNGANNNPYNSVVISYSTNSTNVNSTPDVDYVTTSGTITFASGEATKTVEIPLIVDAPGDEGFEIFNVTFSKTSIDGGSPINADTATVGAVIPDTAVLPVMTLASTELSQNEGDSGATDYTFTVNLDKGAIGAQTVNYAVAGTGSNPADASDFVGEVLPSGSVPFVHGATSGTITISVNGDTGFEQHETFTLTISAGSSGLANGATTSLVGTVNNDDLAPVKLLGEVSITETDAETNGIKFTVSSPDGAVIGDQTVAYAVTAGGENPVSEADFGGKLPSGTVTLFNGESSAEIVIPYVDNDVIEPDKTFTLTITPTGSGIIAGTPLSLIVTVTDDDNAAITIEDVSVEEGDSGTTGMTFTATLNNAINGGVSVNYSTSDGTATAGEDYTFASGTLTFAGTAGETQTFSVVVNGDTVIEYDETFTVKLSNPSNSDVTASDTATGTIANDDLLVEAINNQGFEGEKSKGIPIGWIGKDTSIPGKDKQKCNKDKDGDGIIDKFVAYSGDCAFMFKGNPTGGKSKINHKIEDLAMFTDGATVTFSVYVDNRSAKVGHPFGKLIVKYDNGTKDRLILRLPDKGGYVLVSDSLTIDLTGRNITLVKAQFRNKLTSGKFFIDDPSVSVVPAAMFRLERELLPLPEAPGSFRD